MVLMASEDKVVDNRELLAFCETAVKAGQDKKEEHMPLTFWELITDPVRRRRVARCRAQCDLSFSDSTNQFSGICICIVWLLPDLDGTLLSPAHSLTLHQGNPPLLTIQPKACILFCHRPPIVDGWRRS